MKLLCVMLRYFKMEYIMFCIFFVLFIFMVCSTAVVRVSDFDGILVV